MTCLISCMIWLGNVGYHDTCRMPVTLLLETRGHYYVHVTNVDTVNIPNGYIAIESFNQQLKKHLCTK